MKRKTLFLTTAFLLFLTSMYLVFTFYNSGVIAKNSSQEHSISRAKKALDFLTRARAYPQKDIPSGIYYKSYLETKRMSLNKTSLAIDNKSSWEAIGPLNIQGRMLCLALDPQNTNTLYAGSASGGLWRTFGVTPSEINWERIPTGFPTLGVMAIAVDPKNSNTIYIGTGEVYGYQKSIGGTVIRTTRGSYGIGILKTNDGGKTWEKSLDWSYNEERGIQCIRINPLNSKSIYAATTEGIYKSTDAGANWQLVLPVLMGQDIIIHPTDTSKVMVSCGNLGSPGSGIYRSLLAGKSWKKSKNIPPFTGKTLLETYASSPDTIFASVADSLMGIGLYRSDDFGSEWTEIHGCDIPAYQGWYSHWVAVHPENLNMVIHAGVNLYKSLDGGKTLSIISGDNGIDHHNYIHDIIDPNIIYIACDQGIFRSINFGRTFQNIGYGLQTAQFYNGFSSSSTDSMLAMGGLHNNKAVIFYGTKDWVKAKVTGDDGCWTAINPVNDNILYGEAQYNYIQKSIDRGVSFFSAIEGMYESSAAFAAPFLISPSNPSILYSGRKCVYKTVYSASEWFATNNNTELDGNLTLSMAISADNPDIVYAGTAPTFTRSHIFRTVTGGISWTDVTGSLPDRYPMDIAVDPNNNEIVYVVFAGFGSGHVFKSLDAGTNWIDITGDLPDVPTLSIAIDPLNSDHIYIGNDIGVYVSTDGGTTWSTYNNGLPEAVIAMDLNIFYPNRKIRIATHGNGAFQRLLIYQPDVYLAYELEELPEIIMLNMKVPLKVVVKNMGIKTQSNPDTLKICIFNDSKNEILTSSKIICDLKSKESRQITFDKVFAPPDTGSYTMEFTCIQNGCQLTTRHTINVVSVSLISQAKVIKKHSPYREIKSIRKLTLASDSQISISLPFPFIYNGIKYDSLRINTNGWIEFGVGSEGTEHNLSTWRQIGYNYNRNEALTNSERPNKILAPWWDNLTPDLSDNSSNVSYLTEKIPPNRVFVIQWNKMNAYADNYSFNTTRLSFQVRLYESSNIIEFHYGPIITGTYIGDGASCGFKDHIGGDYHCYDLIGGELLSTDISTTLNPLNDWPGPDSCYVISTRTSTYQHDLYAPEKPILKQNYPNPFNLKTTITYDLPISKMSKVALKIYNILGEEVKTLVNKNQTDGYKNIVWDGKNNHGTLVSSGLYIYVLKADDVNLCKKMVFIK